jgi:hydrogenase maturation protein HypF
LARAKWAFLSQHIGDLENYETLQAFESGIAYFQRLFRVSPQLLAHDLHPNYLAARYALARAEREGVPTLGIQHHHAHLAACLADNGYVDDAPVLGLIFDGAGYGADGAIWGGEALVGGYAGFERWRHLAYAPLPGGDRAAREPWRMALAWLWQAGLNWEGLPPAQFPTPAQLTILRAQLHNQINAPLTSSLGRLFDALAALAGLCPTVDYEAQAAIEFEALVDEAEMGVYPVEIGARVIDPAPLVRAVVDDVRAQVTRPVIAARVHNSLAALALDLAQTARQTRGLGTIALSGGVWQNSALLRRAYPLLTRAGFRVLIHRHTPPNDGGLALGQAAIAAWALHPSFKGL